MGGDVKKRWARASFAARAGAACYLHHAMTRDEFRRVVKKMQDEGVALSMANLMVRTELPRAQIERLLEEVQGDASLDMPSSGKAKDKDKPKAKEKSRKDEDEEDDEDDGPSLQERAEALKNSVLGAAVKQQLGIKDEDESKELAAGPKRSVKSGALMGLLLPPLGLGYSAPWKIAVPLSAGYLGLAVIYYYFLNIPVVGMLISSLVMFAHVAGAVAGGGYAWRFNQKGRRANLFPGGGGEGRKKKKKSSKKDDEDSDDED